MNIKKIIIERKKSFVGLVLSMPVIIGDKVSLNLMNGDTKEIVLPIEKNLEYDIKVEDNIFHITNIKNIERIVLKYTTSGISCLVINEDGQQINVINKNPKKMINISALLIIVILFAIFLLFVEWINIYYINDYNTIQNFHGTIKILPY